MTVHLHRAARADVLADALAEVLADPLPDPFATELVLVPAKGVERWLSQRLSHRLGRGPVGDDGVCAGVEFRSPRSLVAELVGRAEDDPWDPDRLVWPLLEVVDAHLDAEWMRTLARHVGHGYEGEEAELRRGRRYAVAHRLATRFAGYARQRPTVLADWEAGRDTDGAGGRVPPDLAWQPTLWRALLDAVDAPSPVARHAAVVAELAAGPGPSDLPARLSLFGHTRMPCTEIELLAALGRHHEVHLWLPHASPALWEALREEQQPVRRRDDTTAQRVGHPLLAALGRDLRELERAVVGVADHDGELATAPEAGGLLGRLQADIVSDRRPQGSALDPGDRSVQVHACHGRVRQVEVLREVLLGMLADDETLEPRDIVVMCPDIEAYAPLIEAAFGMGDAVAGAHPGQQLHVRLADRSLTQTNPLLAVAGSLLDLAGGRAEASAVLDLLHAEPVRRRFRFSDADLETIAGWTEQAAIRWSFDAAHRDPYALSTYPQNTWRFGLDRVLAGVAVSDDAHRWIGTTMPLDDVGSSSIDLAGRFAEAIDRLQRVTDDLLAPRPVGEWLGALRDGVLSLTLAAHGEEWQTAQVERELTDDEGSDPEVRLGDVRALLAGRLAGRPTRANFRTGSLTVCTMVPMRSVPHRVVCLLGLDDGVFPRALSVDGDDLLARDPLTGERDPRSEDRQLLLDAVLAATDHLVLTYSGADEVINDPRPPAVPLGELIDALEATAPGAREQVVVRHPLQSFDPANFRAEAPFSFDRAALAAARAASGHREQPVTLASAVLPPEAPVDVELGDLLDFLVHPAKAYLRQRLGLSVRGDADEVSDRLPVDLDSLQQWGVGDRLLADLLHGRDADAALGAEWRRGALPPGRLGWTLGKRLRANAEPVAELFESMTQGRPASSVDVDIDLGADRRLRGTVTDLYDERLVLTTYSRLGAKQWLTAWLSVLALSAAHPGRSWLAGAIGRGRGGVARVGFRSVEGAAAHLRDLVAIRDAGLRGPLPIPLKTGFAWANAWRPGHEAAARAKARDAWQGKFGERDDPAYAAVWGADHPIEALLVPPLAGEEVEGQTTRLGAYAARVWAAPLGLAVES